MSVPLATKYPKLPECAIVLRRVVQCSQANCKQFFEPGYAMDKHLATHKKSSRPCPKNKVKSNVKSAGEYPKMTDCAVALTPLVQCPQCGKSFESENAKIQHLATHSKEVKKSSQRRSRQQASKSKTPDCKVVLNPLVQCSQENCKQLPEREILHHTGIIHEKESVAFKKPSTSILAHPPASTRIEFSERDKKLTWDIHGVSLLLSDTDRTEQPSNGNSKQLCGSENALIECNLRLGASARLVPVVPTPIAESSNEGGPLDPEPEREILHQTEIIHEEGSVTFKERDDVRHYSFQDRLTPNQTNQRPVNRPRSGHLPNKRHTSTPLSRKNDVSILIHDSETDRIEQLSNGKLFTNFDTYDVPAIMFFHVMVLF